MYSPSPVQGEWNATLQTQPLLHQPSPLHDNIRRIRNDIVGPAQIVQNKYRTCTISGSTGAEALKGQVRLSTFQGWNLWYVKHYVSDYDVKL